MQLKRNLKPMIQSGDSCRRLEVQALRLEGEAFRTQRVHIHYYYGIRSQKTIPTMVLVPEFHNRSVYGPSWEADQYPPTPPPGTHEGRRIPMTTWRRPNLKKLWFLGYRYPGHQNSPKALYTMVFGPKSLKIYTSP